MPNAKAIAIDGARLEAEMLQLADFTQCEQTGKPGERAVTRVVFTESDMRAREWLKGLYREAGLQVREDAAGNTFARWTGDDPLLPVVGTGSHTDAIPHAGMYDGTLGVLGGLEAMRALQRTGWKPRRSIELVMLTSEEPTRFGIGCLGSRLLAGNLDPEIADGMTDADGETLKNVRQLAGFLGDLDGVKLPFGYLHSFVELHIEQGPVLERSGTDIGVVTSIAAPASYRIQIDGVGGHAGALLMPDRRDALCAAAEIILAVEAAALSSGVVDTVATVGTVEVHPGAVNSVPSSVQLQLDLRDIDPKRRDHVFETMGESWSRTAYKRNVQVEVYEIHADLPARSDDSVVAAIERGCDALGLSHRRLVSRAYHDSLFLARCAPVGMIFVPCRGGVSHRPDEFATVEAMRNGVSVLAATLASLSA